MKIPKSGTPNHGSRTVAGQPAAGLLVETPAISHLERNRLRDSFGREFQYLRLSITESCNFRCIYCLPEGCAKSSEASLTLPEIRHLVRGFAALGISKVRVTGGEPTVRRDIVEVIRVIAGTPGIETVGLTSNGHRAAGLLPELKAAGLKAINFSVDSLDPRRFETITGQNRLEEVLAGVELALHLGIPSVKINVVLMKGLNDSEVPAWLEWVKARPVSVRFIELMPTADNQGLFAERHLPVSGVEQELSSRGWTLKDRAKTAGPAVVYGHTDCAGTIGLIASSSQHFCSTCNRLRITSNGKLRLCLFGEEDLELRPWLQSPAQQDQLCANVREMLGRKPKSHFLTEGRYGNTKNLASIGG